MTDTVYLIDMGVRRFEITDADAAADHADDGDRVTAVARTQ